MLMFMAFLFYHQTQMTCLFRLICLCYFLFLVLISKNMMFITMLLGNTSEYLKYVKYSSGQLYSPLACLVICKNLNSNVLRHSPCPICVASSIV